MAYKILFCNSDGSRMLLTKFHDSFGRNKIASVEGDEAEGLISNNLG